MSSDIDKKDEVSLKMLALLRFLDTLPMGQREQAYVYYDALLNAVSRALAPSSDARSEQEPVAWRWKSTDALSQPFGDWHYADTAPTHDTAAQIEPLYGHPWAHSASTVSKEAVQWAIDVIQVNCPGLVESPQTHHAELYADLCQYVSQPVRRCWRCGNPMSENRPFCPNSEISAPCNSSGPPVPPKHRPVA